MSFSPVKSSSVRDTWGSANGAASRGLDMVGDVFSGLTEPLLNGLAGLTYGSIAYKHEKENDLVSRLEEADLTFVAKAIDRAAREEKLYADAGITKGSEQDPKVRLEAIRAKLNQ